MRRVPAVDDFEGWVKELAVSSRRRQAKHHLLGSGPPAVPAVRRGLGHPEPIVRRLCAGILDRLVDEESLPDLIAAVDDPDPDVAARALHALACEACKENQCRPGDELWVPRALELLHHDNADLRVAAIEALGRVMPHRPDARAALVAAAKRDPHPGVRNAAHIRVRRMPRQPDAASSSSTRRASRLGATRL